jgi:hypothetical protein
MTRLVSFPQHGKIPEIINFQGEKALFWLWFQMFRSVVTRPCGFGPVAAQYILMGAHGRRGLFISW